MGQIIAQYNKNYLTSKASINSERHYVLTPKGLYFPSRKEHRKYLGPRTDTIVKKLEETTIKETASK